jgi:uncharacterized protein (DUF305 family)
MSAPYKKLLLTLSINAVVMFFITYAMIAAPEHFYFNINRVYMALMMVAPMAILMLITMRSMYQDKVLNYALHAFFFLLLVATFTLARTQTPVGNRQFLRSMIPHHSSAILMCEEAAITDPEIVRLCSQIVKSQEEEIAQMRAILTRTGGN